MPTTSEFPSRDPHDASAVATSSRTSTLASLSRSFLMGGFVPRGDPSSAAAHACPAASLAVSQAGLAASHASLAASQAVLAAFQALLTASQAAS